jgi:hypothetical protein
MNKKITTLFISLIIFGLSFPFGGSAMDVSGWAWSNNIGWISMNRLNCDANRDGLSDGTPAGCPTAGTVIPAYGVVLEPIVGGTRNLTGYAWSNNIGWIHFNPAGPFPAAPHHSVRVDNPHLATSTVSGWARALAHGDGWDGWIKMSGPGYGVSVDFGTREFSGFAWSNMVIGWINFAGPNYKVILVNTPPVVHSLTTTADHCAAPGRYTFSWTFHDPGDTQSRFHLQVATSSANLIAGPYFINDTVISSAHSYAPLNLFTWNTEYFWRIMVWDSHNVSSDWSTITSFTTPVHRPPHVNFNWSPTRPIIGEVVTFTDNSECFGPGAGGTATIACASRAWDFNNDGITDSTTTPATTTFATAGRHPVRLTVTDPVGSGDPAFSCSLTRQVEIGTRPPIWIEIPPFIWLRNLWASVVNALR